ncbi:MAG: YkgJ family cysteine cluster protein, partial [Archaeoglobaceae archaeon]
MFPEDTLLFATLEKEGNKVNIPLVCQKCGKCCKQLSHVLFDTYEGEINVEGVDDIKKFLGFRYYEVVEELRYRFGDGLGVLMVNPCPFFKNNSCEVYPARPRSCRRFPLFGDQNIGCPAAKRFKWLLDSIGGDIRLVQVQWKEIDSFIVEPSPQDVKKFFSMAEQAEIDSFLKINIIKES